MKPGGDLRDLAECRRVRAGVRTGAGPHAQPAATASVTGYRGCVRGRSFPGDADGRLSRGGCLVTAHPRPADGAAVIRVLLLDGQPLIRMVLDGTPNLSVIAEAADGAQAVMDVRMPVLEGVEATKQITAATGCRVLVLTTFDLDEYAYDGRATAPAGPGPAVRLARSADVDA
jgi:CheY-like chemotaxis protein